MSLMLSIGVLGGGKDFNPWMGLRMVVAGRARMTSLRGGAHSRSFPVLAFYSVRFMYSYICTEIRTYHQIPHFSLSHSRPFSGLPFYQLNLALTALSSIYLLSRLDRKRKTPNPESRSYLHMIGITTYIIRPFSAHDAKIFFHSYESEWRI